MKKSHAALLSTTLLTIVLTGCGSAVPASSPTAPNVPAASDGASEKPEETEPPTEQAVSPRGNLLKEVGEPAGISGSEDASDDLLTFNVTDIEVDPACPAPYAQQPENGHFVAVTLEAKTGPEPAFSEELYNGVNFSAGSWKVIASNGTTVNQISSGPAYGCFEEDHMIPSDIRAAENVRGKVVFDLPDTSGTLIYSLYGGIGWEWTFGESQEAPNA